MVESSVTTSDLRKATRTIVAVIVLATLVIILTIKNSSPEAECRFLHERLTSGSATDEEFARADELDCGNKGL